MYFVQPTPQQHAKGKARQPIAWRYGIGESSGAVSESISPVGVSHDGDPKRP